MICCTGQQLHGHSITAAGAPCLRFCRADGQLALAGNYDVGCPGGLHLPALSKFTCLPHTLTTVELAQPAHTTLNCNTLPALRQPMAALAQKCYYQL
jgi:hypothetical protein